MPSRRKFLQLSAACAAAPALAGRAWAQDYPSRPVRWLIGFAPGGPNDILARIIGQHLSEKLGQPFVIETRPGAGGNLATQAVAGAAPDGHTLLGIGHFNAINATLYQKLPFDFVRDIVPVAGMAQAPNVLMIHPSVPAKSVAEFIAYLKANPGKLSYASSGNGTSSHLAAELFKAMTGTSMQHVPYRGTGAVWPDLLSGQVQVYFTSPVGSLQYIQDGKLRALAVTTATPLDVLPDVPTVAATVPGFEVTDLVRHRRAESDAGRDRRAAQSRDQRRPCRSQDQGAACRPWRRAVRRDAGADGYLSRGRARPLGPGGEILRRQGWTKNKNGTSRARTSSFSRGIGYISGFAFCPRAKRQRGADEAPRGVQPIPRRGARRSPLAPQTSSRSLAQTSTRVPAFRRPTAAIVGRVRAGPKEPQIEASPSLRALSRPLLMTEGRVSGP